MPFALRFHQFGELEDVLKAEDIPLAQPGDDDILIRMKFASINPADINLIQGTYGWKPELPFTPGHEGVGQVEAVGKNVTRFKIGNLVKPPLPPGSWQEAVCAPADACLKLPEGVEETQLAQIAINPSTAWRMLHDFVELQPGDVVIQNAANSAVGRSVIQIAKAKGWRTVNLVRRKELIPELLAIGADWVFLDDETFRDTFAGLKLERKPRLAFNAVGGESATRVAGTLEQGGVHITYGAMSKQAVKVPNKFLIFSNLQFRGFWMNQWAKQATIEQKETLFADIGALMREGKLCLPVEHSYPLFQFREALRHASQSRSGKILFQC